jgi:sigma-B regulation protein RsbU (phosphoserine phosphatase)
LGDVAVLFTDGVTEAANATGEMWEEDRLIATVRELDGQPCAAVIAGIVAQVRRFEGDQGPSDDITLLVARRATT